MKLSRSFPISRTRFNRTYLFLASIFLSVLMISCKKEKSMEILDLKFPLDTYYVPEGSEITIHINGGNQKYSWVVGDEELMEAYTDPNYWPVGSIQVRGLKKGNTQLIVKDEVTSQEAILKIHVVDPYLVMKAVHLIPLIEGTDYETDNAIRNEVRNESQNFAAFETGEILVLRRNAEHQFYIFKSEEDVARGDIHRSGNYTLSFNYGGPNRLVLAYTGNDKIVEFPIHASNEEIFRRLLDFSREDQSEVNQMKADFKTFKQPVGGLLAEVPQNTSPTVSYSFYLIKDFTSHFNAIYPDVKRVELFQAMDFYQSSYHLKFGEGILN